MAKRVKLDKKGIAKMLNTSEFMDNLQEIGEDILDANGLTNRSRWDAQKWYERKDRPVVNLRDTKEGALGSEAKNGYLNKLAGRKI